MVAPTAPRDGGPRRRSARRARTTRGDADTRVGDQAGGAPRAADMARRGTSRGGSGRGVRCVGRRAWRMPCTRDVTRQRRSTDHSPVRIERLALGRPFLHHWAIAVYRLGLCQGSPAGWGRQNRVHRTSDSERARDIWFVCESSQNLTTRSSKPGFEISRFRIGAPVHFRSPSTGVGAIRRFVTRRYPRSRSNPREAERLPAKRPRFGLGWFFFPARTGKMANPRALRA